MQVNQSSFNNNSFYWKIDPKGPSVGEDLGNCLNKFVCAATFLGSYRQGTISAQRPTLDGFDICARINNWMNENTSQSISGSDFGDKVWKGTGQLIPEIKHMEATKVQISAGFIDHVYAPIIPDSIMLKFLYEKDPVVSSFFCCQKVAIVALTVMCYALLVLEIPLRYIATAILNIGLEVYAFRNDDLAAYYQFRLMLNRDRPLQAISSSFVLY